MERRDFVKSTAALGAGLLILPKNLVRGEEAPSKKLNIALIGAWGRGKAHHGALKPENVVALCDINDHNMEQAAKVFPQAKRYVDWRECLEHKDLDAVVCCTTDQQHAFVATWAMNRGLHVYCEKPAGNTVAEARMMRQTYLKNKDKLATQVGTQRHALDNFARVRELIRDGAIGTLEWACAWGNRQLRKPGYLPAAGDPPDYIHYEQWLGPAPYHPYNPGYFAGRPGANCLNWNMYWDFGSGQVGDMGSHTMDLVWNAIDASAPISAEAKGDKFNPEVTPVKLESHFEIPANDWRPAIEVSWYQGGAMPTKPRSYVDLNRIGHGAMFKGDQGYLVCDFSSRVILPHGKNANMMYYKRRSEDKLIPPLGSFQGEWINAAKGSLKTSCNFDYSGTCIEMMLLGLVAYRVGKKIQYDPVNGRVTDNSEADKLLSKEYRDGWKLSA